MFLFLLVVGRVCCGLLVDVCLCVVVCWSCVVVAVVGVVVVDVGCCCLC